MKEQTKPLNFLISVLFIGLLSFFGVFFMLTTILDFSYGDTESGFFTNTAGYTDDEFLSEYNDAVFKNEKLLGNIAVMDYMFFGRINSEEILLGRDEYLFEIKDSQNGFEYLNDYIGDNGCTSEELRAYAEQIVRRQTVYDSKNIHYIFAVIPNCQTVYSEKVPDYLGTVSDSTRLSMLTAYMNLFYGNIHFINLTDAFLEAKSTDRLFNNTENSINAFGGYIAYKTVYEELPPYLVAQNKMLTDKDVSFFTRSVYGKSLAGRLGLSKQILNHTVSLSDNYIGKFSELAIYSGLEITTLKPSYLSDAPEYPHIMIDCINDNHKLQMLPYFSNTFRIAGYKSNHAYSEFALEKLTPSVVIQFIGENELDSLLSDEIALTYASGMPVGKDPYITHAPTLAGQAYVGDGTVCFAGSCEERAVVIIRNGNKVIAREESKNGCFYIAVEKSSLPASALSISAIAPSKRESTALTVTVRDETKASAYPGVVVGGSSELFACPKELPGLPSADDITAEREYIASILRANNDLNGTNAEYIYCILPDKISVLSGLVPSSQTAYTERLGKIRDMVMTVDDKSDGDNSIKIKAVDCTQALAKLGNTSQPLYCQTSGELTGTGCYRIYTAITEAAPGLCEAMPVIPLYSFTVTRRNTEGGAYAAALGFDVMSLTDVDVTLTPNTPLKAVPDTDDGFSDTGAFKTVTDNPSLPKAVIIRDKSCSDTLLSLLAEHFSVMYVTAENDISITSEVLLDIAPDYIIRLAGETRLGIDGVQNKD